MAKLETRFPIYSRLLKFYPTGYRKRYGQQMMQTLADMLDDPSCSKANVWSRTAFDLPFSLLHQNLIYVSNVMKHETPFYVKRNAVISLSLLFPFFIIIFTRTLQHNHLSSSYVWQSSLYLTIVLLPIIAFCLCVFTFVKWSRQLHISPIKNALNIRRSWLLASVGGLALLIALFVPFHDSTHCLTGNPIKEVRNLNDTWTCIKRG